MILAAIVPSAQAVAANASLEAAGFGARNFAIPVWSQIRATHVAFAAAPDVAFWDAVKALPSVSWSEVADMDAARAFIQTGNREWGVSAPPIPDTGVLQPGEIYTSDDGDDVPGLWRVVQPMDRAIFSGPPGTPGYASRIRRARRPGAITTWVQPLDQFDAYLTDDPLTGEGELVVHDNRLWLCTDGDPGGPRGSRLNSSEPGTFGWTEIVA